MMYTMPKNLLSICVNFALATQQKEKISSFPAVRAEIVENNREIGYNTAISTLCIILCIIQQ